ncbi:hypothetical protein Tco_1471137, partial [Tanacetum coccineum]
LIGMVPRNSTIFLNTKMSLKGLTSTSLAISHSPGMLSSPKSSSLTPNIVLVSPSPTAILAFLQSITALAVAKNPLPTSKGTSSVSSNNPILSFLKRLNGIKFTHDPKSTKTYFHLALNSLCVYLRGRCKLEHELELQEPLHVLKKLHLLALLVMSRSSESASSFVILEVPLSEYFGFDMNYALNFLNLLKDLLSHLGYTVGGDEIINIVSLRKHYNLV